MKVYGIASSILALSFLALTACGNGNDAQQTASEPAAVSSEPAMTSSEPVVSSEPAVTSSEPSAVSSEPTAAATLPAECDSYLKKVEACVEKIGGQNAQTAEAFKKGMDMTKSSLASIQDQAQAKAICSQAEQAFDATAKQAGC